MKFLKRLSIFVLGLAVIALLVWLSRPTEFEATSARFDAVAPHIETASDQGAATFAFGDFGALSSETLQTSAAPWKMMVAALALQEVEGRLDQVADVETTAIFQRFGFLTPDQIGNWPTGLDLPPMDVPLGLNTGYASHGIWPIAVTVGNTGCAGCHSSVAYDADGQPDPSRAWLGGSNSSINLEDYSQAIYTALRDYGGDKNVLLEAVATLYPDTTWQERLTLRHVIAPIIQSEIADREETLGRLLSFSGGLPGATNGLGALEHRLGLTDPNSYQAEGVYNSVPDLGGRVWRTGLLNTNSYAPPGQPRTKVITAEDIDNAHLQRLGAIVAYFTVPSMGVTESVAEAHIDDAVSITAWMVDYEPQPFPGELDQTLLAEGRDIYAQSCAACHGSYSPDLTAPTLVSFPNWVGYVGTDRKRIDLTRQQLADTVNAGPYADYIAATAAEGYIAPPLTGIWSSAPYLHNGSIPTLWHLMTPEARPERFVVGGHALDFDRVGIAGRDDGAGGWVPDPDYVPWAIAVEIDTTEFGLGNGGHEAPFDELTPQESAALLEYLKLL